MNDMVDRQAAMKAYSASDRNGDAGFSIVVFAETAGKAKAYAANNEAFDAYDFTEMRVNRCKELDGFYKGQREMDWMDDDDRIAMVRYANYECSGEVWHPECEHGECPAQQWIPCSERLPDESGKYLVTAFEGTVKVTTIVLFQSTYRLWGLTGRRAYWKVIAWMPLPEPYKEGDQDG